MPKLYQNPSYKLENKHISNLMVICTYFSQLNTGMVPINNRSIVFLGLSNDGITSYPQTVGIYRVTNVKVSGLPSDANAYGTLIIMGIGYYMHLYIDHTNHAWIAQAEGEGSKPTAWRKITT